MSLASWFKKLWSGRVARRLAAKPASGFVKLTPTQLEKLGFTRKSERYIETGKRVTKKSVTISKNQFRFKQTGFTPEKLAQEHRAGTREYTPGNHKTAAAVEAQARAQIATRARFARSKYFKNVEHEHPFIDQNGRQRSELFRGRDLAIMQEYRDDWQLALRINDASLLKRYKKMIVRNASGEQVFPATDLDTIRQSLNRMTPRRRNRFEREVNYLTKRDALAA